VAGMNTLRKQLPQETQAILEKYEASGETSHPEYLAAIDVLYHRHLCRLDPYPEVFRESMQRMAMPVYTTMWGPNEFTCTGNLQSWDRTDRLGEISVPTLITVGRYDEVTPSCAETMHRGISGSKLVLFENSSHSAHLEEPDKFRSTLLEFLQAIDQWSKI